MEDANTVQSCSDLFGNYRLAVPANKRTSERGELLKYFLHRVNAGRAVPFPPAYLGMRVAHLALPDLYYMKSVGEDYERRGVGTFSKYFWGALKVPKGT